MNILTVSACPFLLTKTGKMNSDVLRSLKEDGHEINSAVWHLDTTWFVPEEDGTYTYEYMEKNVCTLYPISKAPVDRATTQVYEIVKKVKPEIVVFIGDYTDAAPLYAIRSLEPDSFKLFAVLAIDALPINDKFHDLFNCVDIAVSTTKEACEEIKRISNSECEYLPYGADHNVFKPKKTAPRNSFKIMNCSKNSQASSTAAFIYAMGELEKNRKGDFLGYLHTNFSGIGDYDIDLLKKRLKADNLELPVDFVSLNDGVSGDKLNELYNDSDIILDVSVRSSTGLCVLEGIATGCIPLVTKVGALREIVELISDSDEHFVDSVTYVGENEEEYEVANWNSIVDRILYFEKMKKERPIEFGKKIVEIQDIASHFSREKFVDGIRKNLEEIGSKNRTISVEVI